jgi:hypothetical protein
MKSTSAFMGAILSLGVAFSAVDSVQAGVLTIFAGMDDGALAIGPFPNSKVERNLFNAAASAFGPFRNHTLEGQPVGFHSTVNLCCGDGSPA